MIKEKQHAEFAVGQDVYYVFDSQVHVRKIKSIETGDGKPWTGDGDRFIKVQHGKHWTQYKYLASEESHATKRAAECRLGLKLYEQSIAHKLISENLRKRSEELIRGES
jgi:hypothetical protein